MANNTFRSDRGRDPLAELARLIGQSNPSSGGVLPQSHGASRPRATAARETDWAPEERYDPPAPRAEARYAAQPASDPYASPDYRQAQDRYQDAGYQNPGYQERAHDDQRYSDQGQPYQDQAYQGQAYQGQAYQEQPYQEQPYQDQGFDEPAGSRFFSGQAGQFNGFRGE